MKWLDDLETKVKAATEQLDTLRKQNRSLKTKVKRLERQIADSDDAGAAAWQSEREETRERVAKLADDLDKLLAD